MPISDTHAPISQNILTPGDAIQECFLIIHPLTAERIKCYFDMTPLGIDAGSPLIFPVMPMMSLRRPKLIKDGIKLLITADLKFRLTFHWAS